MYIDIQNIHKITYVGESDIISKEHDSIMTYGNKCLPTIYGIFGHRKQCLCSKLSDWLAGKTRHL